MDPTSLAARTIVAGNKLAASVEGRVRKIGSFLFIVAQSTQQIFGNLQGHPKKIIYLKFAQAPLFMRNSGALAAAQAAAVTEQRQLRVHHVVRIAAEFCATKRKDRSAALAFA